MFQSGDSFQSRLGKAGGGETNSVFLTPRSRSRWEGRTRSFAERQTPTGALRFTLSFAILLGRRWFPRPLSLY